MKIDKDFEVYQKEPDLANQCSVTIIMANGRKHVYENAEPLQMAIHREVNHIRTLPSSTVALCEIARLWIR